MKKPNKARKRICAILFAGGFLITSMAVWKLPSYAEEKQQGIQDADLPSVDVVKDKDETVYVLLNGDGTVKSVHVVNTFPVDGPGLYKDYGVYSQVVNLSNSAVAQVRNGAVTWELAGDVDRFYYEGTASKPGELPFALTLSYSLDGKKVSEDELAGAAGHVALELSIEANTRADAYYQQNYIAQVSIPLDMEICRNISAPEASTAISGKSMTATYMVMAGQSGEYRLEWDTTDFSMDEISMIVMDSSLDMASMMSSVLDTDALIEGVGGMSTVMGQMLEGTKELEAGAEGLTVAGSKLKSAGAALVQGYKAISTALGQMALTQEQIDELKGAQSQLDSLAEAMGDLRKLLGDLQDEAYLAEMLGKLKQMISDAFEERLNLSDSAGETTMPAVDTREWSEELTQRILSLLPPEVALTPEQQQQLADTVSQAGGELVQQIEQTASDAVAQQMAQILMQYQDQLEGALEDVLWQLETSPDMSLDTLKSQFEEIARELDSKLADLQAGIEGIATLSTGLEAQRQGLLQLSSGMRELNGGLSAYVDGISQMVDGSSALPEGVKALTQGQELIKNGLDTTKERMDEMLKSLDKGEESLNSYAAPEQGAVRSVQFVYRIDAIKSQTETTSTVQEEEKGFWERVLDLFR